MNDKNGQQDPSTGVTRTSSSSKASSGRYSNRGGLYETVDGSERGSVRSDVKQGRHMVSRGQSDKRVTKVMCINHEDEYLDKTPRIGKSGIAAVEANEQEIDTEKTNHDEGQSDESENDKPCQRSCRFYTATAFELLQRLKSRCSIVTFSKSLDELLGGGILPSSGIYEICGCPGTGKTQLCMQLAVNVQIPKSFRGNQKQAIYIDTEGSFSAERCYLMADGLKQHLDSFTNPQNISTSSSHTPFQQALTINDIMDNIFVFRIFDEWELFALIIHLEQTFLTQHENIGLIIIDSISFPFRSSSNSTNLSRRLNLLIVISTILNRLATHQDIAIVITNQMTTRFTLNHPLSSYNTTPQSSTLSGSLIVPCLGDSWAHVPTHRLLITRTPSPMVMNESEQSNQTLQFYRSLRSCELLKSNGVVQSPSIAQFEIRSEGVRDVVV